MRWALWILILLMFGTASAITADLELDRASVALNNRVRIVYSFELDEPDNVSYELSVDGGIILNETRYIMSMSSTYYWNVTNTPAGNYSISFMVNAGTDSASTSEAIEILPSANISVSGADEVYCFDDVESGTYNVSNTGNVPVRVTTSYEGEFRTISPLTFDLDVDGYQDINIEVLKPDADTIATLIFTARNGTLQDIENETIDVIVPYVNITLDDFVSYVSGNETVISVIVNNSGNMDQNLTFEIITSVSLSNTEGFQHNVIAPMMQRTQHNFTIPTKNRIALVVMHYTDDDGTRQSIERRFELTVPESITGAIGFIMGNETLRGFAVTFAVLVVLVFLWKLFRWRTKKRPSA